MRVGRSESEQQAAGFRAAIEATLTGAGLSSATLKQRGVDAVEVSFTLRRPATLAKGQAWDADGDAEKLVGRALAALTPRFEVARARTGRMTALVVSRPAAAALAVS